MARRILSGVQPSGKLHLGNYFGAIQQHILLQQEKDAEKYYFIADYHALTTVRDAKTMRALSQDVALDYLALGLDPQTSVFYAQSDVPEVTELTWLLATVTGMGLLARAHSYKDKVSRGISPDVGLFVYPVLMAADILAPQADLVPVGLDQKQHIEMTRDMAGYFNRTYGEVFKLPDYRESPTPKVPGTTYDKATTLLASVEIEGRDKRGAAGLASAAAAALEALVAGLDMPAPRMEAPLLAAAAGHLAAELGESAARVKLSLVHQAPAGPYLKDADGEPVAAVSAVTLALPVFRHEAASPGSPLRRQPAKMSKSYGNTIDIFAEGKALRKQVMGIETDARDISEPLDPDDCLVFSLYRMLASPEEQAEMAEKYRAGGFGYGNAKLALLAKIDAKFAPARERRKALAADPGYVEDVLRAGAARARAVCRETVEAAREACGLRARTRG